MNPGILYAFCAYVIWGMFPIYFKSLQEIPPLEVLMYRMVWALVFLAIVLSVRRQWSWLKPVLRQPRVLAGFTASALLLSSNWYLYIWSVNNDRVIDASLGYFMTPLVNVLLGSMILGERLRRLQWMAVGMAAIGVLWLTWQNGQPPWVSLLLGITFGLYGLLRKTASLGTLEGLSLETMLLLPLAVVSLLLMTAQGAHGFSDASTSTKWLMLASGPITAIPLLLFGAAARLVPLSTMGLMQYITPSLQLMIGIWLYHEPFGEARLIGFAAIWIALGLYSLDGIWQSWRRQRAA
ncbi:EamA family transporter RarD [Herminiimonas sp. NPDC097707]|uniref:EamA family transporter RarD n=1 Tax=Herminiimonas sp. NPDC097707 TaxID=3364007 RepID=UPI00383B1394